MNSEIITSTDYYSSPRRRRGSRRRKTPVVPILLFLLLLLGAAAFFFLYWLPDITLKDRYPLDERSKMLLHAEMPERHLSGFASDLCVVEENASEDTTVSAMSMFLAAEGDSRSIYALRAFDRMNPASTTKIMTCLVAMEAIAPDTVLTAGPEIFVEDPVATLAGIKEGDRVTAETLFYGLMLKSGADAANILALNSYGSNEAFIARMNEKAQELGATGTHFVNTHGLTAEGHYTTAYDLYLIMHAAMQNDLFRRIAGTAVYQAEYIDAAGNPVSKKWANTNYYLAGKAALPEGLTVVSGKTGTTLAAGSCLALVTEDTAGQDYYSILLKSATHDSLYRDSNILLEKIALRH